MSTIQKAFKQMQWSFLFFIDYSVNGIDILPDIVGLLVMMNALGKIINESPHFAHAKKVMPLLIVLASYELIEPLLGAYQSAAFLAWFAVGRSVLVTVFNIMLVWLVCNGLRDWAIRYHKPVLARTARRRGMYFSIILACSTIMIGFALISPTIFYAVSIPMFMLYIIVTFLLMGLFGLAAKEADTIITHSS
ncbi:hypothetical protein [Paenibacillus taiwanensis]|uniref:hypothetical protein n=1 Tax=Paenibacillus taiwanensis TaxID=401638 RepID=UPI00040EA813|nr:hypothetical protein [Paenibacillus taiwanensis]